MENESNQNSVKLHNPGPRFFFKHQNVNKYTLQNLAKAQLWMSKVNAFNDPFEFQYHIKNKDKLTPDNIKNLEEFQHCGVMCLATHPELKKDHRKEDSNLHPNNMLMWSHYSNNHYGICLGLRKKTVILPVIYSDTFPIIDPTINVPVEVQLLHAMHRKQKCWEYEVEYRMVTLSVQNEGVPMDQTFQLERIYFGLRTPDGEKELIKNILNDRDILFYQAILNEDDYQISFEEIKNEICQAETTF